MKTAKLLAAATVAFASLSLLMAQQVDATAHQNASAPVAGGHAGDSANTDASVNANHGYAIANGKAEGSTFASSAGRANASASSSGASSADMRQVTGQLEGKLDSKTARPGDHVVLKTSQKVKTADGLVIPRGSRLIGHVTEVQAHGKSQAESRIGLEFDRVELKGGQSMRIHSMIESVEPSASAIAAASMADEEAIQPPMGGGAVGGGAMGGGHVGGGGLLRGAANGADMATGRIGSELGSTTGAAVRTTGSLSGDAAGHLGRSVSGAASGADFVGARATGIQGVMLNGDAAGSASGMLSAANRNIHLESGTQMVLGIAATR